MEADGSGYKWDMFVVKPSTFPTAGNGVFAKLSLEPGIWIPILGMPLTPTQAWDKTHSFILDKNKAIDGCPTLYPHKGVGSLGMAIAMMVNENSRHPPNCAFFDGYLVTYRHIAAGEELTVYYGGAYDAVRLAQGYTDVRSPHLRDDDLEAWRAAKSKMNCPTQEARSRLTLHLLGLLEEDVATVQANAAKEAASTMLTLPRGCSRGTPSPTNELRTVVLRTFFAYCMSKGLYLCDQRSSTGPRLLGADNLPCRVAVLTSSSRWGRGSNRPTGATSAVPYDHVEKSLRSRYALPSTDVMKEEMPPGQIHFTCNFERHLSPTEARSLLGLAYIEGAHVIKVGDVVRFQNSVTPVIKAYGTRFHTLSESSLNDVLRAEALAIAVAAKTK